MIPTTMPAERALKMSTSIPMLRSSGVVNVRAKYPKTTVGMPASISRLGFSTARIRGRAYSAM